MKKILQFAIASSQGGYTQYITNIWRQIDKSIIHFDFVTFSKSIKFAEELIKDGSKVYQMSVYPEQDMNIFVQEFESVLNNGYDAIEIHTSFWKSTIVEQLAKKRGISVIIHAHSTGISKAQDAEDERRLFQKHSEIQKKIDESLADYYWACSKAAAEWLYGNRISQNRIEIIKNTIDTLRFAYDERIRQEIRKELNLEGKYVIGHVGRLERVKNQHFLLEIFSKIKMDIPKAELLVVGDGSLRNDLEYKAQLLGVKNSVSFIGKKMNTELYYHAMDIFTLPSLLEGFSIVLLEAQCNGLVCVCSDSVPKEVMITENVHSLSLSNTDIWIKVIEKYMEGYKRRDGRKQLIEQGYDTFTQIHYLEKRYLEIGN